MVKTRQLDNVNEGNFQALLKNRGLAVILSIEVAS